MGHYPTTKSLPVISVRRPKWALTLTLLLAWPLPVSAWSLGGTLRLALEQYPDLSTHEMGSRIRGRLWLEHDQNGLTLHLESFFRHENTPLAHGSKMEMGEFYLSWQGETFGFKIGRQQLVWGRADGFRLLDRVNPWRIPDLAYDDAADARRPLWMVRAETGSGSTQWQGFLGRDHRRDLLTPGFNPLGDGGHLPQTADFGGMRLETFIKDLSLSLYWLDHPDFRIPPESAPDTLYREQLFGGSADLPTENLVWRGEIMIARRHEPDDKGRWRRRRRVEALIGLDWQPGNWLLSPQLYHRAGDKDVQYGSLLVRWSHFQDRLDARIFAAHQLNGDEFWISFQLGFLVDDHLELRMEGDWFRGEPGGVFFPLADASRTGCELVFRF